MSGPGREARVVRWTDLGRMAYEPAWRLQRELVAERKEGRGVDRLLLVEHDPPVLTLGRRFEPEHLLASPARLRALGIERYAVERAGDVTYHGPGQLVAYPLLDLRGFRKDVRWFSESLLGALVETLARLGLSARARAGRETGVWLDGAPPAKVAALGLRIERWVTYHGVALNVDPEMAHFDLIVPCGLTEARTTSLRVALGRPIGIDEVKPLFLAAFAAAFDCTLTEAPPPIPAADTPEHAADAPGAGRRAEEGMTTP